MNIDEEDSQKAYKEITKWSYSTDLNYTEAAKMELITVADSLLITKALVNNSSVVTLEKNDPNKKRIKIPNACKKVNVEYLNTINLLRELKIKFKLV